MGVVYFFVRLGKKRDKLWMGVVYFFVRFGKKRDKL